METGVENASHEKDRRERARARSAWPVRAFELGAEPGENLRATTTATERLAMMWPLAEAAWRLAGRELPRYKRAEMPCRVLRRP